MTMIGSLPPELFLLILSHLTLNDIHNAHLVCSEWHTIIQQNAETVYLHAALLHSYLPSEQSPFSGAITTTSDDNDDDDFGSDVDMESDTDVDEDEEMKEAFSYLRECQKQRRIERAWTGHAPSYSSYLSSPANFVHRFKVDEKNQILICSHKRRGINVWCIRPRPQRRPSHLSSPSQRPEPRLLWKLDNVRPYAHVEYSNGYLVFDREEGKEVWKHSIDVTDDEIVPLRTQAKTPYRGIKRRGTFVQYAILTSPEPTRAFRFVYPTLLVASENNVYLWDVPRARLVSTIHDIQGGNGGWAHLLGRLTYVELSERHVFVAGVHGLSVLKRPDVGREHADADEGLVLYVPTEPTEYGDCDIPSLQVSSRRTINAKEDGEREGEEEEFLVRPLQLEKGNPLKLSTNFEEFVAVHVDPSGSQFVALFRHARLLIVNNFDSESRIPASELEMQDIQLGPTRSVSKYLAFENGRAAVATTRGVFIVHLPRYSELDPSVKLSELRVGCVRTFGVREGLKMVTCLQLTKDALWMNWMPSMGGARARWVFDEDEDGTGAGRRDGAGDGEEEMEEDEVEEDSEDEAIVNGQLHHFEPSVVCRISLV